MTTIHHINCGTMQAAPNPTAICHCLLLEDANGLALIDTGIGLVDTAHPIERFGQALMDIVGLKFNEADTAVRQIERIGFDPKNVTQIVITHADPDHTSGLVDFPTIPVYLAEEELANLNRGNPRYLPIQFAHRPDWRTIPASTRDWFGLEARPIPLDFSSEVLLIPLFGHTLGHCGVAISQAERWVLYVGDAYYLRVELTQDDHPVSALTTMRADDNSQRLATIEQLRRLVRDHADAITLFGYHDMGEFPTPVA